MALPGGYKQQLLSALLNPDTLNAADTNTLQRNHSQASEVCIVSTPYPWVQHAHISASCESVIFRGDAGKVVKHVNVLVIIQLDNLNSVLSTNMVEGETQHLQHLRTQNLGAHTHTLTNEYNNTFKKYMFGEKVSTLSMYKCFFSLFPKQFSITSHIVIVLY